MASTNPLAKIEPIAPCTGTLLYPGEALLTLAFFILRDLGAHYMTAYQKAGAEGDEEAEAGHGSSSELRLYFVCVG